jgi:hypothetical protein
LKGAPPSATALSPFHSFPPYLYISLSSSVAPITLSLVLCYLSRSLSLSRSSLSLIYFFCDIFGFVIFKTRFVYFRKSKSSTHHSTGILGFPALSRHQLCHHPTIKSRRMLLTRQLKLLQASTFFSISFYFLVCIYYFFRGIKLELRARLELKLEGLSSSSSSIKTLSSRARAAKSSSTRARA